MANMRELEEYIRWSLGKEIKPWQREMVSRLAQERAGMRMYIDDLEWEPIPMKLICAPTKQEAKKYLSAFNLPHHEWLICALGEYIKPKGFTHAVVIFPKGKHVYETYYDEQIMPRMVHGVIPLVL